VVQALDYIIHDDNGRKMKDRNNNEGSRSFLKYGTSTTKKIPDQK
jgi:hypothetical protein